MLKMNGKRQKGFWLGKIRGKRRDAGFTTANLDFLGKTRAGEVRGESLKRTEGSCPFLFLLIYLSSLSLLPRACTSRAHMGR